ELGLGEHLLVELVTGRAPVGADVDEHQLLLVLGFAQRLLEAALEPLDREYDAAVVADPRRLVRRLAADRSGRLLGRIVGSRAKVKLGSVVLAVTLGRAAER